MRPTPAFAVLLFLTACSSTAESAPPVEDPAAPLIARARSELDGGAPFDALVTLDDALAVAPRSREVWSLRATALLEASTARGDANFLEDSLAAWERALALGAGSEALFGASRAARGALKGDVALDYARRGLEADKAPTPERLRIASEAHFDAYIALRQAQDDARELFEDTEELLLRALEAAPADPWPRVQLANLYQWEGRDEGAVELLGAAVELDLDNEPLHTRFAALKRSLEGPESVLSFYESLHARHPDAALAPWFAAQELFARAQGELAANADASASFERAEQLYRACREKREEYGQACLGYEVICRAGIGWSKFHTDDLEAAERAFLSMEVLFPGGMEWQVEGGVRSGVVGLQYVADKALREAATSLGGFEVGAAAKAARIYARLHAYRPSDGNFANNAGFFHREWGVGMAVRAREYRARAEAASDPAVRDLELALAEQAEAQEREILTACRDAYLDAARLLPEDVRIVNDAALILVYHFPSRAAEAEQLLLQSVANGAKQKDEAALAAEARDALLEAWGDAHQNLGVLELLHRRNPQKAREWFKLAYDIGPRPRVAREWVEQVALPLCDEVAAGQPLDLGRLDPRIAIVE